MELTKELYYETLNEVNKKLDVVEQIKEEVHEIPIFKYAENNLIKEIMINNITRTEVLDKAPDSFHLYLINEDKEVYFKLEQPGVDHQVLFLKKCADEILELDKDYPTDFKELLKMNGYNIKDNEEKHTIDGNNISNDIIEVETDSLDNQLELKDIVYFYNLIVSERHIEKDNVRLVEKEKKLTSNEKSL